MAGKLILTIAQAPATASALRSPRYISPSAVSVSTTVNGGAAQVADISGTSPNCTTVQSSRVCTVPLQAPVGNDTFVFAQYDGANATGKLLGSATVPQTVTVGTPFQIQAVLTGVVGSIQLALGTLPPAGSPGTATLFVSAYDPDDNLIIGPGNYAVPIALSVSDPSGQTTLSTSSVAGPAANVNVIYAGGAGVSATITGAAAGASPGSVVFAPTGGPSFFYYVSNANSNTLTAYSTGANGNAAPVRTVGGNLTGMSFPRRVTTDQFFDLIVANAGANPQSITVYRPQSNGNVTTIQDITGPATQLTGVDGLRFNNGILYVANCGGCFLSTEPEAVLEFSPGASGNVAPFRVISGSNTTLFGTTSLDVDGAGNLLVPASGIPAILVFPVAASGNVAPSASLGGAATGVTDPECVVVDSAGLIYVCNAASNSITVYAAGSRGNVAPLRTLSGAATLLASPTQLTFDTSGNMYVANAASNTVTEYPVTANGNQAPSRTVTGSNTGLNEPIGIAFSP